MISSQSYLIQAIYSWVLDSDFTPYIMVDTNVEGVAVPEIYVRDDKIVLNVNPSAVENFSISHEALSFSARFSGKHVAIYVPILAVKAIYAKEIESGMMFNEKGLGVMFSHDVRSDDFPPPPDNSTPTKSSSKPTLKVVK
jgi:stringent starvation protein B